MPRSGAVLLLSLACTFAACGDDDANSPTTPVGPAVASVSLSQSAITVGSSGTAQVVATARDASGAALLDRIPTWSSSNNSVANVGPTGVITAIAPGTSTITATIEGKTASVPLTVLNVVSIPLFQRPFVGDFLMANFMDHDIPYEFVDDNGRFTTFWGEVHENTGRMIDGHSGYDWSLPTGTPVLAVAAGTVVSASTSNPPFYCPLLKKDVSDMISVIVQHTLPDGSKVNTFYMHLSQLAVATGQVVTAGTQLGLSGNTGCTTSPHLHFETYRPASQMASGHAAPIDPYGWAGSSADPWEVNVDGAPSIYLWKAGEAPALRRGATFSPGSNTVYQVLVTQLASEGVRDDVNPNNEYVELSLNSLFAAASLDGYQIRGDKSGATYPLPQGITLTPAKPRIRIYTGPGVNTATTFYMGRPAGIWSNSLSDDCLRMVSPTGPPIQINLGNGCPAIAANQAVTELPVVRDFAPRPPSTPKR